MKNITNKKSMLNRKFRRKEYWFVAFMLFLPLFYHVLVTYVLGFYNLFFTFQQYDDNGNLYWVGFENFRTAWNQIFDGNSELLLTSFGNSMLFWSLQNVVMWPIIIIFSLYIAKGYRGNRIFRFAAMVPTMVTGLILSQIFVKVMEGPVATLISKKTGEFIYFFQDPKYTRNTVLGYALWSGIGSTLIIYPNAMNAIDQNIVEASKIDGCTDLKQLWHVYLPGIWPTITVAYFNAIGGILTAELPTFLFYEYGAPNETYTFGYYMFARTMKGDDRSGPILNALSYFMSCVSIPMTLAWKYFAENYGPSEDENKRKKKRYVETYEIK